MDNTPAAASGGGGTTRSTRRRPSPVQTFSYRFLLIVPVLLAIATALLLFVHSDVNVAMLYSQCHARSRLHWLSRVPVLGGPSCFLVSFFQEAAASVRSAAALGVVLSFVAGLLTVSTVEAARLCNGPAVLIAYPTGPWLVFNLVGGALVWELVIIPAFFLRSKQIIAARAATDRTLAPASHPDVGEAMRHLSAAAEVAAIPIAVAVGFILPSVLMLVLDSPAAVIVWLFFPVYVSLIRQGIRFGLTKLAREHRTWHLESHRPSLLAVYALPILCSVASYVVWFWSLAQRDDRREMTRATVRFIEIDMFFIVLTVLYWIFVETCWEVALVTILASAVLGPGGGLCVGWIYREGRVLQTPEPVPEDVVAAADDEEAGPGAAAPATNEETPLLQ